MPSSAANQPGAEKHSAILEEASKISKEVGKTVEQLHDLESRLKSDVPRLGDAAFKELNEVSSVLQHVERTCSGLRTSLESENITWSGLRHEKIMFPVRFNNEIHKILGVLSCANTSQLDKVKMAVDAVDSRVKQKEAELASIQREVIRIRPLVVQAQESHEHDVQDLNDIMAEKARMRILLNEKRAEDADLCEENQDLERKIREFQEKLAADKAAAEKEIDELSEKAAARKKVIADKEDECFAIRREISVTQGQATLVGEEVKRLKGELGSLHTSCHMSHIRKLAAKEEYDETALSVLSKQANGRAIEAARLKETEDHKDRLRIMKLKHEEALETMRYAGAEIKKLEPQFKAAQKAYHRSIKRAEAESGRLTSIQSTVDSSRTSLLNETQECSTVTLDYEQLIVKDKQLEQGLKAHATLAAEARQDAHNRLRQKKERKIQLLIERDIVMEKKQVQENAASEQTQTTQVKFQAVRYKCEELKTQLETHTNQVTKRKEEITKLGKESTALTTECRNVEETLVRRRDDLQATVATLEARVTSNAAVLDDLKPAVEQLKEDYELLAKNCDEKRKKMIELKNKKASFVDQIGRVDRDIEKLHMPQERLLSEIRTERTGGAVQLQDQCLETQDIERKLFHARRRVDTLRVENDRFVEAIKEMDDECARTRRKREESETVKEGLQQQLEELQARLAAGWASTSSMEKEYASGDEHVMQSMGELMEKLQKRHTSVLEIENRLETELAQLSHLKDSVSL